MNYINMNFPSFFYHYKQEKTPDVNVLINDVVIQKDAAKPKNLLLTHLAHHNMSGFDFHKK